MQARPVSQRKPSRPSKRAPNRRASPEAVEKRRAARAFNEAVIGGGARAADGRTERRRKRILEELGSGTARGSKRELKPIEVLTRVQELLALGEPLAAIRKVCPKPRPVEVTPEVVEGLRAIHRAYAFPVAIYELVGLGAEALREAGLVPGPKPARAPARRGPARRAA
ncbi:MAG: hypothetical protein U0359_04085 [Byssovorax sp.]